MIDISEIRFDANGLVPAVVVDKFSRQVLMLAYMNRQSLEKTMDTGLVTFWSRSRQELWTKGETSGNYLHAVSVTADCDRDSLLVVAEPDGPACHHAGCLGDRPGSGRRPHLARLGQGFGHPSHRLYLLFRF